MERLRIFGLLVAMVALGAALSGERSRLLAQDTSDTGTSTAPGDGSFPQLSLPGELGFASGGPIDEVPYQLSGTLSVQKGSRDGKLTVKAILSPKWHIYSTTQKEGGPKRTVIHLRGPKELELVGDFRPDRDPHRVTTEIFPVPEEQFSDAVEWTAKVRLADGVDPEKLEVDVVVEGQVCLDDGACKLLNRVPVPVTFSGFYEVASAAEEFRAKRSHVVIRGRLDPQTAAPGDTVKLVLEAVPDPNWHVYALERKEMGGISKPTLIVMTQAGELKVGPPQASSPPIEKKTDIPEEPIQRYHEKSVTWTLDLQVPGNAKPGEYELAGRIGYQACQASTCDPPTAAEFSGKLVVQKRAGTTPAPLQFTPAAYAKVAELAAKQPPPGSTAESTKVWEDKPLAVIFALAFLGGLILNVMPCVLPVIGLKIMSFVQQAGESRLRIFSLNMWFSLGLLSVFWALATIPVVLTLLGRETIGWGGQFQFAEFNIVLSSIVFVFALSFLGVWEVPIPGVVGTGAATELATREGAMGAFTKGILATLLATPCSGPLMGPAVGWALAQPPLLTYAAFTFLGLGMAFPYLLIGIFPNLLRALPKPGAWMDTFKQLMGFVLMGTVVWMFSFIGDEYTVPLLTFFVGLGLACWMIGRISITAEGMEKAKGWTKAVAVAAMIGWFAFGWLMSSYELPYVPYDRATLDQHLAEGRTVLVDFTADW